MTRWCIAALAICVLTVVASTGVQWAFHERMPESVPIHWGFDGRPNGWAQKDQVFLIYYLLPTIMFGTTVLGLFVLPRVSPTQFAVADFRQTYDYVFALVTLLLAYLHAMILSAALAGGQLPERPFIAGLFVFFALIGNVLGKLKPNFWMGIRTPWTLADPQVWERTHRVGAWSFTAVGILGAIATLLGVPPMYCFIGLLIGVL